jgi:D-ribose pyranose/furanose isomerase RbsD
LALLASGLLGFGLITACGGSNKTGNVSPASYVSQVCTSLATWFRNANARAAQIETQVANTTPQRGKSILESTLSISVADAQTAISALQAAGVPHVENGQKIATTLIQGIERNQSTLQALQPEVAAVSPTDAEAVRRQAHNVAKTIESGLSSLASGTTAITSPELARSAARSETCKSVGARPV